jgi:hypothetical protein
MQTLSPSRPHPILRTVLSLHVPKERDRHALEGLVRRHQAWIYNIAARMLYHPHDAEDATATCWRASASSWTKRVSAAPQACFSVLTASNGHLHPRGDLRTDRHQGLGAAAIGLVLLVLGLANYSRADTGRVVVRSLGVVLSVCDRWRPCGGSGDSAVAAYSRSSGAPGAERRIWRRQRLRLRRCERRFGAPARERLGVL